MQEERIMHEAKLAKMEAEMKMVFQQKVQEKEAKLKQSEEELYARHREMKEALEKQRLDLEDKKRRVEGGRPLTPEKTSVGFLYPSRVPSSDSPRADRPEERLPQNIGIESYILFIHQSRCRCVLKFCCPFLLATSGPTPPIPICLVKMMVFSSFRFCSVINLGRCPFPLL
jgi:hypothetical protein